MEVQEIHHKLERQCASDYRINEIIPFSYPYRRLRISATVNRSPELSIQQIYSSLLRAIKVGYSEERDLIRFLGLHEEDFILRELYFLRERGYTDFTSGKWLVTNQGEEFIRDNSILKVLEEEEFEFLLDMVNGELVSRDFKLGSNPTENRVEDNYNYPHKSPDILVGKNEELSDVYKQQNHGKAYLIDFDKNKILFDKGEFCDHWLIEYIPREGKDLEPYVEVRNVDRDLSLNKRVTKVLSERYPTVLYKFSNSERTILAEIERDDEETVEEFKFNGELPPQKTVTKTLSVWETQSKFSEALSSVKKRILIESPWVKRATLSYLQSIEKALKNKVKVIILYGIESNDMHDIGTIDKLKKLEAQYEDRFYLIHLPTHFNRIGKYEMTGTHRKLVIKDDEYFIQGSFNFLSFNKKQGEKVANEESILIGTNVDDKWRSVISEYQLVGNFH